MQRERRDGQRKQYESPRLVVYGDVRSLTANATQLNKSDNPSKKS